MRQKITHILDDSFCLWARYGLYLYGHAYVHVRACLFVFV